MTTLGPVIVLLWVGGALAALAVLAQVSVAVTGWPEPGWPGRLARTSGRLWLRFVEDVKDGLLNVVEWLLYGAQP